MNTLTRKVLLGVITGTLLLSDTACLAAEQSTAAEKDAKQENRLSEYTLEDQTVVGDREDLAKKEGLVQKRESVSLLGEQDALSLPFDAVTLGQESFENYAMPGQGLTNVLTLDPAVRSSSTNLYNDISIRGFNLSGHAFYVNGIPGLLCQENIPTLFADRVTVIAGPGSGINTTSLSEAAGGSVNVISKKAQDAPNASVKLQFSGKSSFEESVDIGQRLGKDKRYGIRVNASNLDGSTSVDNEKLTQRNLFLNIDQRTSQSNTNLLIGYNYTKHKAGMWPISFKDSVTSLPSEIDGSRNLKPDWAYNEYDNWIVALNHEQKLSKHTSLFLDAGYHHEDWYGYIDGSPTVKNTKGDYTISLTNYPMTLVNKYIGFGVKGDFTLGHVKNQYILHVDHEKQYYALSKNPSFGATLTGNLYTNSSWAFPGISDYSARHSSDAVLTGWHVADTVLLDDDRLALTAGLHGHRITQDSFNTTTGRKTSSTNASAICPTFGINYKVSPTLSVYANHSESFGAGKLVGTTYANAGEILDPAKTKQNEIGIKLQDGKLLHTLSAFQIQQANTTVEDNYLRMNGEQNDNGIQYMVSGTLSKKWEFVGGFMYLNAKQAKTANGLFDGKPVNGAAQWSGVLSAIYKPTPAWSVLARMDYMGPSVLFTSSSRSYSELNIPAYMTFDLGVTWKTKIERTPVTFSAMCYNVLNKNYWKARTGQSSLMVGSPRTFMLSAQFDL